MLLGPWKLTISSPLNLIIQGRSCDVECNFFWFLLIVQYKRIRVFLFIPFGDNHSTLYTSANDEFDFRVTKACASRPLVMDLLDARQIFNMNFTGTGTIELAQEDALPGP